MDMSFLLTIFLTVLVCFIIAFLIYKQDKVEKEPIGEILKAFIMGIIAVFIVLFINNVLGINNMSSNFDRSNIYQIFMISFVCIALVEELCKYICTWIFVNRNPNFDYLFDGIVYFALVGLGFALVENILYATTNSLNTIVFRLFTSIPAHTIFGISSGYYYALYRRSKFKKEKKATLLLVLSIMVPIILHGIYDFLALTYGELFVYLFILFIGFLYCYSIEKVTKLHDIDDKIEK